MKNLDQPHKEYRTLLAVSLVLLLLLLFATLSTARAQDTVLGDAAAGGRIMQSEIQEKHDARHQSALQDICLDAGMSGKGGEELTSPLPVGSSVNLASFSSTSTGWKAQLVYSLATLFFAASLLWFSTPSRRLQAGGSPPPPAHAIEHRAIEQRAH